ncbi:MAG: HNH endonuclease [Myxococcota bacterium]|nr:HNH endonuclease [Myxococcota bacterium]
MVQRVGQDIFRNGLLDYWDNRCAVTGLGVPELLRASHIKPWADCERDDERLDVFNGLLLAPHLDAAFDHGFITFGADGVMVIANELCREDKEVLGLQPQMRLERIAAEHRPYLEWHRERVFRG